MTALPAWSAEAILEEVLVTPRSASLPVPDLRRIERPGWVQIITPSFRTGGLNEVMFSALADDEADAVIDATIAEYRALGIAFRWAVPPGSAPADLGARLVRRGLFEEWGRGMARGTTESDQSADRDGAAEPSDRAIRVDEIDDAARASAFTRVMADGWGRDPAPLRQPAELRMRCDVTLHRGRVGACVLAQRPAVRDTASNVRALLVSIIVLAACHETPAKPPARPSANRAAASDPAASIYVAYNGWSGNVTATLPTPRPGKTWFRVGDTAPWMKSRGNSAERRIVNSSGRGHPTPAHLNWQSG